MKSFKTSAKTVLVIMLHLLYIAVFVYAFWTGSLVIIAMLTAVTGFHNQLDPID